MIHRVTLLGYYALKFLQACGAMLFAAALAGALTIPFVLLLPGGGTLSLFIFMAALYFSMNEALGYLSWYRPSPMDTRATYPEDE